ncbi:hypothetical protein AMAG_04645 [Allomyces macrogynus ATCC 38327]|uniref:Uncharacterized protein n=1 Tax=Allomyces macrogynus (strain ATCC 38327) TaxID=578462 RepID=A0A0L0S5L2_ALLM3|nr:hypothetical protein GGF32_010060 [Allomyces javanicus]KAJ3358650.1 hypothetical protein GGF32_010075 [Allomyces javanicus]KNE57797.1 hypothetical protein AMAG_04645 [Allomyces macrogynus ATCC 38327]|eukprot:KNE57797.1 hypothetical protein AMAG_04645 [Allomyces macrogynus ATCC 38327]
MSARQFSMGLVGGLLVATTFYNFSRTNMDTDFEFLRRKIDGMTAQLRLAQQMANPTTPIPAGAMVVNPHEYEAIRSGTPAPNLLTSFSDAWNRLVLGTGSSVAGRY